MDTVSRSALMEKYGEEEVLVIKRDLIPVLEEGFSKQGDAFIDQSNMEAFFMKRYDAEGHPENRQLIPYVILIHEDKSFATTRLPGAGEDRLCGKVSIGTGGHINRVDDFNPYNVVKSCIRRELNEELDFLEECDLKFKFVGVINDNSSPVSQDHLGLVYVCESKSDKIYVKETDKHLGRFYKFEELRDMYEEMESWSQIVFNTLLRGDE